MLAGKNLQAQYERWQPRAKYKAHLDPTLEDVKAVCASCRKHAKVGVRGGAGGAAMNALMPCVRQLRAGTEWSGRDACAGAEGQGGVRGGRGLLWGEGGTGGADVMRD